MYILESRNWKWRKETVVTAENCRAQQGSADGNRAKEFEIHLLPIEMAVQLRKGTAQMRSTTNFNSI